MPVEDGVAALARSMRRAAQRAEDHAKKWEANYMAAMTPQDAQLGALTPEQQTLVDEMAAKTGCFCDILSKKKDDRLVCVDLWSKYLSGEIEVEDLKERVDAYFGVGAFDKTKETTKEKCPV